MDLSKLSNDEIIFELDTLVKSERKITHEILCYVVEVEVRKIYADLGYGSSIEFLIKHHRYSEGAAYRRRDAARVLMRVPEIACSLKEGSLNLTQLTQVQGCLKQEKKSGLEVSAEQTQELLVHLQNKNGYETKKIIAVEFNHPVVGLEKVTPQRDDSVVLQITVTSEQMQIFAHAKELVSHLCPEQKWADVFTCWAQTEIQKREGKKSKRASKTNLAENDSNDESTLDVEHEKRIPESADLPRDRGEEEIVQSATVAEFSSDLDPIFSTSKLQLNAHQGNRNDKNNHNKRKYISVKIKRLVLQRANHACEYCSSLGKKCESTYKLQVDHIIPIAKGGSNNIGNLRALCQTHNLSEARRWGFSIK